MMPGTPPQGSMPNSGMPPNNNRPNITPPPTPEVNVRTMNSDMKSVERGDAMPLPESVLPKEMENEPVFSAETANTMGEKSGNSGKKRMMMWILGIVIIGGLGAVGYFVIYPKINPAPPPVTPPPTPPPAVQAMHRSAFKTNVPSDQIQLNNIILSSVMAAFQTYATSLTGSTSAPVIKELAIVDGANMPVIWKTYFKIFGTNISEENMATWFDSDFTAFVYHDDKGTWPGYVLNIKDGIASSTLKTSIKPIEESDISKFYINPPGTFGAFKDGKVKNFVTRYATSNKPGVALNYGIVDKYFVLSASYKGFESAVTALGF